MVREAFKLKEAFKVIPEVRSLETTEGYRQDRKAAAKAVTEANAHAYGDYGEAIKRDFWVVPKILYQTRHQKAVFKISSRTDCVVAIHSPIHFQKSLLLFRVVGYG